MNAAVVRPPIRICPSAPQFQNRMRKAGARDTLMSRGVNLSKTPLSEVDPAAVGWLGVMGLLVAAVHEERRSCGTLKQLYENGSLLKWLKLLKKHDDERTE